MRPRLGGFRAVLGALILVLTTLPLFAQDPRGGVTGVVTDATGSVLPGVTVTVTNVETNVPAVVVTDAKGFYRAGHLNSGHYSVEAKLEGFKTVSKKRITRRVGDALKINVTLDPGGVEEVISVTAQAPLIDTTSGITGQVIDSHQIEQLPLGDGTAYMLTRLAPGIMDSSHLHFSLPMDNGNLAGITSNDPHGGNQVTLPVTPNRASPYSTDPVN